MGASGNFTLTRRFPMVAEDLFQHQPLHQRRHDNYNPMMMADQTEQQQQAAGDECSEHTAKLIAQQQVMLDPFVEMYIKSYQETNVNELFDDYGIRVIQINTANRNESKTFFQAVDGCDRMYQISDIKVNHKDIRSTPSLVHIQLDGECRMNGDKYCVAISILLHCTGGNDYLVVYESVNLTNYRHEPTPQSEKNLFNFSNKNRRKQISPAPTPSVMTNNNNSNGYQPNSFAHPSRNYEAPISRQQNQQQAAAAAPSVVSNDPHGFSDAMSGHSTGFASQSESHGRPSAVHHKSVPIQSGNSYQPSVQKNRVSHPNLYAGTFNSSVDAQEIDNLISKKDELLDGEQKAPSSNEKFNSGGGGRSGHYGQRDNRRGDNKERRYNDDRPRSGDRRQNNPREDRRQKSTTDLYVIGMPDTTTEDQLRAVFEKYGEVSDVVLKQSAGKKPFAHVYLKSAESAKSAVEATGQDEIDGSKLKVDYRQLPTGFRSGRNDRSNFSGGQKKRAAPVPSLNNAA